MAGSNSIDIIALHIDEILSNHFIWKNAACGRTKFMTIRTLEYDTLAIQAHDIVDQFKSTETNTLLDNLLQLPILIINLDD